MPPTLTLAMDWWMPGGCVHVHARDAMDGNEAQKAHDLHTSRLWWHAAK